MKTQYGRTLVEILGALALIGALTFIGVESYKILYAKHQANEAFESVQCQMLELDLLDLDRIDLDEDITSDACENDSGVEIKVVRTEMEEEDGGEISSGYYVELTDLTPEACRQILSKPWETEFEIAVGCEGRTFNPDEPDYSVCDIFDEDYEPECLEEYIEEYIEEDIGEVSLLDNALPSDSIFHKILGISNAYAAVLGRKDGKYIRIYYQRYVPLFQCSGEEMVFGDLRKDGQTVSFCCLGKDKRYYNGTNYACCSTDFDVFSVREGLTEKKNGKDVLVQDCCYPDAIYDIYDTTGAPSGTKYCCEDFVLMDNSDVQVEDIKPNANLLTADDVYDGYKKAADYVQKIEEGKKNEVPKDQRKIFYEVWQKIITEYQVPMTLPILGKKMPTEVRLVNCEPGTGAFISSISAPHAVFFCATSENFKKFLEDYRDKEDLTPDIFFFLSNYLHERGHGLDQLNTQFKNDGTNISDGIRIMISEVRSRLIEYKFAYDFFKVNDKGKPTQNKKFWEAAVKNKYHSFYDDGWKHFFPNLKYGLREALNKTARYLFDSWIARVPSYGGRAGRDSSSQKTRNLDLDSFISRFPDDDVISHKDLKDIFLNSQAFWAWVCTEYADLNLIQCMQQQDAKRACGGDFKCCDKETQNLFCAKWEDDKKLKCADGYCTCCPIDESVYWKNKQEFGCCENGNVRQIPGKEAGLLECCPKDTSTAYEGQSLTGTDGQPLKGMDDCRCPLGYPIWDQHNQTCNACTTNNWDENYCSCEDEKVKKRGGSDLIDGGNLSWNEKIRHYVWADGPTCVLDECIGKSYCFTSQDECCPCGLDEEKKCNTCKVGEYDSNADTGEKKACYSCPKDTYWSGEENTKDGRYAKRRYSEKEVCTKCPGGMKTDAEGSIGFKSCHCPADKPVWYNEQCTVCPGGAEWKADGECEGRGRVPGTSSYGYACYCPAENPVWYNKQCTVCPGGAEWITYKEGVKEKLKMVPNTLSNFYACFCPAENPVWYNKQCTVCPGGAERKTYKEGVKEKLKMVPNTLSNFYACFCPAENPVWDEDQQKCVSCPGGAEWKAFQEGRGYVPDTDSNGYACLCPAENPVWYNKQCTVCPGGAEWKELQEGRRFVPNTLSNFYACYCPAANPVWDGTKCGSCPTGTDWITTTKGEEEKRGYVTGTVSNDYACHCLDANSRWDGKQCVPCPTGSEWIRTTKGKEEKREEVAGTSSNGYACYCPDGYYFDKKENDEYGKCVPQICQSDDDCQPEGAIYYDSDTKTYMRKTSDSDSTSAGTYNGPWTGMDQEAPYSSASTYPNCTMDESCEISMMYCSESGLCKERTLDSGMWDPSIDRGQYSTCHCARDMTGAFWRQHWVITECKVEDCPAGTYQPEEAYSNASDMCPRENSCTSCPKEEPYSVAGAESVDDCFSCPENSDAFTEYGGAGDSGSIALNRKLSGDRCYCKEGYVAVNNGENCCPAGQYWNGEACAEPSCPEGTEFYNDFVDDSAPTGDTFVVSVSETDFSLVPMTCMCPEDAPIYHNDKCNSCSDVIKGSVVTASGGEEISMKSFITDSNQTCYCPKDAPDFTELSDPEKEEIGFCETCQKAGTLFYEDSCKTCHDIDPYKPVYNNGVCEKCPGNSYTAILTAESYPGTPICDSSNRECYGKENCYCDSGSGYVWCETAGTCVNNETICKCDYDGDGNADDGIKNESGSCESANAYCVSKCQSKYGDSSSGSFNSTSCDCVSPYGLCDSDGDNSLDGIDKGGECKNCNDHCGSSGSLVELNQNTGICQCSDTAPV